MNHRVLEHLLDPGIADLGFERGQRARGADLAPHPLEGGC